MFERWVGIDWSGAATRSERVNLAVARGDSRELELELVHPPSAKRKWTRNEALDFLFELLKHPEPHLIGVDAAFGFPAGFARAWIGVEDWTAMVKEFGRLEREHGRARDVAAAINGQFEGGPFRFNESRNDRRFYLAHDVAYFRQTDLLTPQCLSAFYMGSGAAVGFHTITFLACLSELIEARERREVDFQVWPFEGGLRGVHTFAEVYPALLEAPDGTGELSGDERDAMKIVHFLREGHYVFEIQSFNMGRHLDFRLEEQIASEGWILGPSTE